MIDTSYNEGEAVRILELSDGEAEHEMNLVMTLGLDAPRGE